MAHFKKFFHYIRSLKVSDYILFAALFAAIGFLTYLFYFFPNQHEATTVAAIDCTTENESTGEGIGGGSIVGNPTAGKKISPFIV